MAAVADMKIGLPYPMCESTCLRYTVTSISSIKQFSLSCFRRYGTGPIRFCVRCYCSLLLSSVLISIPRYLLLETVSSGLLLRVIRGEESLFSLIRSTLHLPSFNSILLTVHQSSTHLAITWGSPTSHLPSTYASTRRLRTS